MYKKINIQQALRIKQVGSRDYNNSLVYKIAHLHNLLLGVLLHSLLLRCHLLYLLLLRLHLHLNLHRTTAIVRCLEGMKHLATGAQSYRTCQLQQWPRHFCAVSVDAVGFLLVDHSGGCRGCVCTLLTKLLQCIWTLAGQGLQELLHAMLWYAASLLSHKLLVRARAIQGVIHCWKQSSGEMGWGSKNKQNL